MFSFCAWIHGWVNIREAGDLRHHRELYDAIEMKISICYKNLIDQITPVAEFWDMYIYVWIEDSSLMYL